MAHICLCGERFNDPPTLRDHSTQKDHKLRCACGHIVGVEQQLREHRVRAGHPLDHPFAKLVVKWTLSEITSGGTTRRIGKTVENQESTNAREPPENMPTATQISVDFAAVEALKAELATHRKRMADVKEYVERSVQDGPNPTEEEQQRFEEKRELFMDNLTRDEEHSAYRRFVLSRRGKGRSLS